MSEPIFFQSDHGEPQQLRHFIFGLNPLFSYLRENGHDPLPYMERAGISAEALNSTDHHISPAQEIGLTLDVYQTIGVPELGLTIGPRYHLSSYGMLGLAATTSATLADCYRVILDNILLTWTYFKVEVYEDAENAYLEMSPARDLGPCIQFMIDRDLTAAWGIACDALGHTLPLKRVEFKHHRPSYADVYNDIFDCPIEFGAAHNRFCFERPWLHKPLPEAEPETSRIFADQCHTMVHALQAGKNFTEHVRYFLLNSDQNHPSLESVSKATNIPARTIQRRLAAEDTTFQEVLNSVRLNVASEFLLTSTRSMEQIADKLGYSDAAAFSNAFKRMTGKSPSAFRKGR